MAQELKNYHFIEKIEKLPFVKKVILYGSRGRGDNRERSDIDLAVDCSGATDLDWVEVVELVEEADTLLKVDCVRLDKLDEGDLLKRNILLEGKTIYKKESEQ